VVTSVIRASLAVVKAAGTQRAKQREKLAFFMLRSVTCQVATPTGVSATLGPDAPARDRARGDPPRARSLRQRARLDPRHAKTACRRLACRATLPWAVRHLPRVGRPRLVADDPVPDPSRGSRGRGSN